MVQEFMSLKSQIAVTQINANIANPNNPIPTEPQEVPPPKDYIDIAQKPYEILFNEEGDQHELTFELDAYLGFNQEILAQSFDHWYKQKFLIILKTFNEINETAIQADQVMPKLLDSINDFEGNMVHLFIEVVENLGYSVKEGLLEAIFQIMPFIRFINVIVTTKKSEFVASSRNLKNLRIACIDKKIEISKDKVKDQYPKLFENKTYKGYTQKDTQPINVITIEDRTINLYEGLHLIKTSLFVDVYESPELAEKATFRSFVCRMTNLLKRNIAVLKHKHAENAKVTASYQYLRRIDGGKTTLDEMVKEVYRQSIATQLTIEDIHKPEAKTQKNLEKYIEKEKSIADNVFKLYDQINLTAQALKLLGAFRGDVQKVSYIGHLNSLLYQLTGNLYKKPQSLNIAQSAEILQFLESLIKQIQLITNATPEINNGIFKANQLKRMVDNQASNQSLNLYFHSRKPISTPMDDYYRIEIFKCLNLPEAEMISQLDKLRDEFMAIVKEFKDLGKKA